MPVQHTNQARPFGQAAVAILASTAATVAALFVAPAEPAFATLSGVERVMDIVGGDSENKSLSVPCPTGKRVVAVDARVSGGGAPYVHITALVPTPVAAEATAEEYRYGTLLDWELTVWAVCATPPPGLNYQVEATQLGPETAQSVVATCAPGTRAIGLGAIVGSGRGRVMLRDMVRRYDETSLVVRAVADREGPDLWWNVAAYVVCADVKVHAVESFSDYTTQNPKAAGPWCAKGSQASSAGFTILDAARVVGVNDVMTQFGAQGGATAYEFPLLQPAGGLWSIGAQVLCVR